MATWEAGLADEVIAYTRNLISSDGAFRTELERGVRTATGTSAASCHSCHSHSQQSCHLNFAQGENDYVGSILTTTLQPENLAGLLSAIFDSAGSAYANMKKKAPLENDDPEAATVRHMTLRGALLKIIRQEVHRRLIASLARHAEDAELYADPSRMDSRRFTQIPNNCMAELLGGNDYTVLHTFTSPSAREAILKQCVRLHADGCLLTDFAQTFESLRADKQGWLTAASLDREQMPQLLDLLTSLELLPYEMNFKARLDLQSSNRFELSLFTNGAAGHKKHSDNPALMHRGVRFAMMFFPNDPDWQDSDAGELVLWSKTTEVARIKPCGGDLVLLQSDKLQWSVTASRRDRFTISTWLTGPKAP